MSPEFNDGLTVGYWLGAGALITVYLVVKGLLTLYLDRRMKDGVPPKPPAG